MKKIENWIRNSKPIWCLCGAILVIYSIEVIKVITSASENLITFILGAVIYLPFLAGAYWWSLKPGGIGLNGDGNPQ